MIGKYRIEPDPERIFGTYHYQKISQFLGMANQIGSFSPRFASLSQPLRQLLSKDRAWLWEPQQQQTSTEIKAELTSHTVLAPFNVNFETQISVDAFLFGIGAIIRREQLPG